MSSTSEWAGPPWGQLQFGRDCELYGTWLAAYGTADIWNEEQGWTLGANFMRSIILLKASLPAGWRMPTSEQAARWWVNVYMVDFDVSLCQPVVTNQQLCTTWAQNWQNLQYSLFTLPSKTCAAEVCKAYARAGNPDLAGVGVGTAKRIVF